MPITLDWSSSHITVLGSCLANDGVERWEKRIQSLDSLLACWSNRSLSYHGRALIANTLGLSLFWYLASFSCIPPDIFTAINTRVFSFIWQKKREWLARSSVTQRCSLGGLGLVDVQRKINSLHALRVRHLVEHEHLPWVYFFRRHLTIAFSGCSLDRILLLPSAPKCALAALPPFYRSVMVSWFALTRRMENGEIVVAGPGSSFCALRSLTASFVYRALEASQRTQHRCTEKYQSLGFRVEWQRVWSGLNLWRFIRPVRDTAWLTAHGILPTADRLIRFGMNIHPRCHCGNSETLQHLFVDCPFAVRVLSWYFNLLHQCVPSAAPPTPKQVLLGYGRDPGIPPVMQCLLGIVRHQFWKARNAARLDNVVPALPSTTSQIKSSLRFAIRTQQRHCHVEKFSELWLANDRLGTVLEDGSIHFTELVW